MPPPSQDNSPHRLLLTTLAASHNTCCCIQVKTMVVGSFSMLRAPLTLNSSHTHSVSYIYSLFIHFPSCPRNFYVGYEGVNIGLQDQYFHFYKINYVRSKVIWILNTRYSLGKSSWCQDKRTSYSLCNYRGHPWLGSH